MADSSTSTREGSSIDQDLEAGQTVGEYVIDKKIGQGGFGAVYKATHPLIGKLAAIKVLARKFSVDPEMLERFVAEAKAVNQIRHRHIIDIFSFGQVPDGRHYYLMEYLDGEPLDARIDRDGAMSLGEALPILRAIARALDAAHAKGIAHRDLKPENIFLARDEDGGYFPKLLDFGIAKLLGSEENQKFKTRTGIPMGTPYYMSPEQCRGKDVDHRTDYYAFGVVAYRLLTGELPIDGDDYMTVLMRQVTDEPKPPSSIVQGLPSGVDDAIAWLMKKDPAARPRNLMMSIRALEAAAEGSGIEIIRGALSAAWDVATPGPDGMRAMTGMPNVRAASIGGSTTGMPPPRVARRASNKRMLVAIGGGLGAVIAGLIVFMLVTKSEVRPTPAHEIATTQPTPPAGSATAPAMPAVAPTAPPPAMTPAAAIDAAPAPAPVATVTLTLVGAPDGSEVVQNGRVIATLPDPVTLPRDATVVALVVRHAGFGPTTISVTPDQDREVKVTLHHASGQQAPGKANAGGHDDHDIENPFK